MIMYNGGVENNGMHLVVVSTFVYLKVPACLLLSTNSRGRGSNQKRTSKG